MKRLLIAFTLCTINLSCFAWGSIGHRIIAQIAEDNITQCTANQVNQLLAAANSQYPGTRNLVLAADWLDNDDSSCPYESTNCLPPPKSWHFIDRPYAIGQAVDMTKAASISMSQPNVVWAINQAISVLDNPQSSSDQKVMYLLVLDHLVGDISQPLHNINGYDQRFLLPAGDHGGNFYSIKETINCQKNYPHDIDNLHSFWDQGAGLFTCISTRKKWGNFVSQFAKSQEQQYQTHSQFKQWIDNDLATNTTAKSWSLQAYAYAPKVYSVAYNDTPSTQYVAWAQGIAKQQLTLAGYRLAKVLNQVFIANGQCKPS